MARRPRPDAAVIRRLSGVVTALVVAGCSVGATPAPVAGPTAAPTPVVSEATAPGETLRWAVAEPAAITPPAVVDDAGLLIVDALFDSLTRVEGNGTVTPSAAIRWRAFGRGRRWRFTLRSGARYHDGTPVRADDFAAAWAETVRRGLTGAHLRDVQGYGDVRAGRADRLRGVRPLGTATLEVTLRRPSMELPAMVAHPSLAPLPASAAVDAGRAAVQPVGNGPYRITERWRRGQFIRVERDEAWRNGARARSDDRVREIVFRILDRNAAYVAFQQGRVDVTRLPAGALEQALRTYGPAVDGTGPGVVDAPLPSLYYLAFRVDRDPWRDPEVRRALSRAIDRSALVDAQQDLALDPARWIVPPALALRRDATVCGTCLHMPSLAEEAFAAAGVTALTMTIDEGGGHERVARQLQSDLRAVGVSLAVRTLPFDEYLAAIEQGDLGLYRFGWQALYPSPAAMLEPVVGSARPAERGDGASYGGYRDRAVDRLLARARTARSERRRHALWTAAERRALAAQPIVPLFSFRERTVVGDRVRGLQITPWSTAAPERATIVAEPDIEP